MRLAIRALGLLVLACATVNADDPTFQGEWRTSLGDVTFKPEGGGMKATFSNPGIPPVKGEVKGKTATLNGQEGQTQGNATLTLDDNAGRSRAGSSSAMGGAPHGTAGARTRRRGGVGRANSAASG